MNPLTLIKSVIEIDTVDSYLVPDSVIYLQNIVGQRPPQFFYPMPIIVE